jgi:D-hydroxyproline dehydrogenase subunit alpha
MNGIPESADTVVVGGGPAGIAAAGAAAESGRSVLLVDRRPNLGGNIWYRAVGEGPAADALSDLRRLERGNLRVVASAEVLDVPRSGTALIGRGTDATEVAYGALVLATGARERFLPFPGWTLPNVTGAGGLQLLAKAGAPLKGRRVVVAGTGPLLLAAGAYLRGRGADVRLIAEQTSRRRVWTLALGLIRDRQRLRQALDLRRQLRGVPYLTDCWPLRAEGEGRVQRVTLRHGRKEWSEECDLLACGYHLVPNTELAELLGCRMESGFVTVDEFQATSVPRVFAAGEPVGIGGMELARIEGEIAGRAATEQRERARGLFGERRRLARFRPALDRAFRLSPQLRGLPSPETIICRCEDVSAGALRGYGSGREARLQTRCGMGRCQGRVCGPSTEFLWGWSLRGTRPPIVPATVSQLTLRPDSPPTMRQS